MAHHRHNQQAPVVETPFTPEDPDTYTGPETVPVLGPSELSIPPPEIHAHLVDVGLEGETSRMEIPSPEQVGHYTLAAPIDAAAGSTLLAGHVKNGLSPGGLWNLSKAQGGAHVDITDQAGKQFTYKSARPARSPANHSRTTPTPLKGTLNSSSSSAPGTPDPRDPTDKS